MNRKGFTLIELLIVVVIIGILAAIAIPKFGETRERAYVAQMRSDLNQIRTAQEMYYQDNLTYAAAGQMDALNFSPTSGVTITIATADATSWTATAAHGSTSQSCSYDSTTGVIGCSGGGAGPAEPDE